MKEGTSANKRTNKRGDPSINDNNKLYDTRNKRLWKQALRYNPQNTHQFLARLCHESTHARDVFTYFAFCSKVFLVPFICVAVFRQVLFKGCSLLHWMSWFYLLRQNGPSSNQLHRSNDDRGKNTGCGLTLGRDIKMNPLAWQGTDDILMEGGHSSRVEGLSWFQRPFPFVNERVRLRARPAC